MSDTIIDNAYTDEARLAAAAGLLEDQDHYREALMRDGSLEYEEVAYQFAPDRHFGGTFMVTEFRKNLDPYSAEVDAAAGREAINPRKPGVEVAVFHHALGKWLGEMAFVGGVGLSESGIRELVEEIEQIASEEIVQGGDN